MISKSVESVGTTRQILGFEFNGVVADLSRSAEEAIIEREMKRLFSKLSNG